MTSTAFLLRTGLPAIAALACGLFVGVVVDRDAHHNALIVPGQNGALAARDGLANALSEQLASDQSSTSLTRIGVSYHATDGRYCRSFQLGAGAGVACRDRDAWTITAFAAAASETNGAYQPAGAAMPEAVRAAIKDSIAGEPLDAAAERQARDRGWAAR